MPGAEGGAKEPFLCPAILVLLLNHLLPTTFYLPPRLCKYVQVEILGHFKVIAICKLIEYDAVTYGKPPCNPQFLNFLTFTYCKKPHKNTFTEIFKDLFVFT